MKYHYVTYHRTLQFMFVCWLTSLFAISAMADEQYTFSLSKKQSPREGHLQLGTSVSPSGHTFSINSSYYIKDGKPWYPVMGEMHYARVPRTDWEESILKMKASGVTVIATYVFWNFHEEVKGKYTWGGNKDLHHFLELCKQHGVYVWLRIGPWCHGEVRYGGLPDWLMPIEGGVRKDNPAYIEHVKRFFTEIAKQADGQYFKDGGPIIGLQIENEYRFGDKVRLEHMLNLKRIAVEAGMDVPYYTATGWPKADLKQTELIPVWGGYPEAPWSSSTAELPLSRNYVFSSWANDPAVGADLLGKQDDASASALQYPYSTAEMGGGNQVTYHRRPIITSKDVVAQSYVKVGSGANMMGYYMYHGGSNPIGECSTLQESKATNYPNDYPIINYDFYAPIGEWGQLNESYYDLKVLHAFLNDFGEQLAPTSPTFPEEHILAPDNNEAVRMSVRSHDNRGFVFINNYQRMLTMKEQQDVRILIHRENGEEVSFPAIRVAAGEQLILPFDMDINDHQLKYATAQPMYLLKNKVPTYVFFSHRNAPAEFSFSGKALKSISLDGQSVKEKNGSYLVMCDSEKEHLLQLKAADGTQTQLLVLTQEQARQSWKLMQGEEEYLCITASQIIPSAQDITVRNVNIPRFDIQLFPADARWNAMDKLRIQNKKQGCFRSIHFEIPEVSLQADFKEEQHPESYIPAQPLHPEDDRKQEVPASCPGPQYFVNFKPVSTSLYYSISMPKLPQHLKRAYMLIDYTGDTSALYRQGGLIADDYFTGLPMMFNLGELKELKATDNDKYLLQIIPFAPEVKIYLDPMAREKVNSSSSGVRSIQIKPVYDVKLKIQK